MNRVMVALRESKGLTQRDLAYKIGVTDQTISNWESGRSIPRLTPRQYSTLLDTLGCTPEDLEKAFTSH